MRKCKTLNLATEEHRISQKSPESSVKFCENPCQSVANRSYLSLRSPRLCGENLTVPLSEQGALIC